MARNGSGTYTLPSGNPVVTGSVISSTTHNSTMSDIATALTNSLAKDGQTTPSADLPMGGYKHTGVAVAAARDQYATAGQVQDGTLMVLGSVSGVDTITATAPVSMSAYAAGQEFVFVSAGANTGAVTLNINSLGAKAVTKNGTVALVAGNIPSGAEAKVVYDGTQFQLLNPKNPNASQAEMEAGTESALRDMSPLGVSQAIASLSGRTQVFSISASVDSNALTISAGTLAIDFRSATLGSGTITRVSGDPADLVISSGSTLGTLSGIASKIAVIAMNNAGTIELAATNIAGGVSLDETGLISTTAEGGAGAADSATVVYSTTARTDLPYRVLGYIESTQATAGTWATAPSKIQGAGGESLSSVLNTGLRHISTTTVSAASVSSDITLSPGKRYRVVYRMTKSSTSGYPGLRFNADSGSNYAWGTAAPDSGAASLIAITGGADLTDATPINGWIEFETKRSVNAAIMVECSSLHASTVTGYNVFRYLGCGGYASATASDIASFRIVVSAGTYSGTIYLYEYVPN